MLPANKVGCRNLVNLTGPGIHIAYFSLLLRFYLCDPFSQRQTRQQSSEEDILITRISSPITNLCIFFLGTEHNRFFDV